MTACTGLCRPGPAGTLDGHRRHPLMRFATIGGAATALQLALFALLQVFMPVFWANIVAWAASTVVGNQVNRSLTFDRHGRSGARQDFLVSTVFSTLSLGATTLALVPVDDEQPLVALIVLVAVNSLVGLGRFLGLRRWYSGHQPVPATA